MRSPGRPQLGHLLRRHAAVVADAPDVQVPVPVRHVLPGAAVDRDLPDRPRGSCRTAPSSAGECARGDRTARPRCTARSGGASPSPSGAARTAAASPGRPACTPDAAGCGRRTRTAARLRTDARRRSSWADAPSRTGTGPRACRRTGNFNSSKYTCAARSKSVKSAVTLPFSRRNTGAGRIVSGHSRREARKRMISGIHRVQRLAPHAAGPSPKRTS